MTTQTLAVPTAPAWRLPLIVGCIASIATGFALSVQEIVPDQVAMAMKVLPMALLVVTMPWWITSALFNALKNPAQTYRLNKLLYWLVIALAAWHLALSLIIAVGLSCEPTAADFGYAGFWGLLVGGMLLMIGPFLREAAFRYRTLAWSHQQCYACGYDLQMCASADCPECGEPRQATEQA